MDRTTTAELPLLHLAYRYWFFGWLFRDVGRGTWLERQAALRHNRERARWLPVYIRRWVVLCSVFYASGILLEFAGLLAGASVAFTTACLAVTVVAVAIAAWLVLSGPGGSGD